MVSDDTSRSMAENESSENGTAHADCSGQCDSSGGLALAAGALTLNGALAQRLAVQRRDHRLCLGIWHVEVGVRGVQLQRIACDALLLDELADGLFAYIVAATQV